MKKVILFYFMFFIAASLVAQSVVVNSPASIAGSYQFGTATGWGADLTTDIWTADGVMMMDEGANTGDGCDTVTNKAALAGKIVLVNRGTCNFSFKALQAQDWGAIGCIIVNNVPNGGVAGMGAGTFGPSIRTNFPVVMISFEDGAKIKAEMANGPVNISIGNIRFDHDVATNNRAGICHASYGTFPGGWIRKAGDFTMTPACNITNKGKSIEGDAKGTAIINFTPQGSSTSEIYNKLSVGSEVIEVDSTRMVAFEPIDFFGHIPSNSIGKGVIKYTVNSESIDESPFDNVGTSEFYLSKELLSKARLNSNLRDPIVTNSYRSTNTLNVEFIAGFEIPYGKGCSVDSVIGYIAVNAPLTLANFVPEAVLYGWDDVNLDGIITNDELSFLALGSYTFSSTETRTGAYFRIALEDFQSGNAGYPIPSNDIKLLVGVRYSGPEVHFFGFDEGFDFTLRTNQLRNLSLLKDTDLPYIGVTAYDPNTGLPDIQGTGFIFNNVNASLAASLVFSSGGECLVTNKQLDRNVVRLELYPNPVTSELNVDIVLDESSFFIMYSILDVHGKTLLQRKDNSKSNRYETAINVSDMQEGVYFLEIRTDRDLIQKSFIIIR